MWLLSLQNINKGGRHLKNTESATYVGKGDGLGKVEVKAPGWNNTCFSFLIIFLEYGKVWEYVL